ncbi:MAG: type VI secretion system tip protein TssI/VgrG [Enhygromyxa sp.]
MTTRLSPVTYTLELSEHSEVDWRVTKIHIREALNRCYQAIVEARTEVEELDTDALLGCDAVLSFGRSEAEPQVLCGLVSRVDFLGHEHDHLLVRVHLVPALQILEQHVDSRIFQQQSVRDVVAEVLDLALEPYGRSFDLGSLGRATQPRDYCVQYRESDFAFVSRLLEEEGISYEFVHDGDRKLERLALRDDNDDYAELRNVDGTSEVPIITSNPELALIESIQAFEWSRELTSTAVLRRDYDWQTPRELLNGEAGEVDERGRRRRRYEHGRRRLLDDDLERHAQDRREAMSLGARVVRGRSNVTAMRPGLRFVVSGHSRDELDREYLLTAVEHSGAEVDLSTEADTPGQGYANRFECVPADAVIRPALRTQKPREYGPQTAIVTGPPGEEIHTDEHGRVQVQFYWQEHPSYAAESSCWVRCAQSSAGMGWGAQFIPRIGMEVVVEFLEGNPDRPLVTGCVYNSINPPPFPVPEHKSQSGWRSQSTPGGGGSNELRFEDAAGSEEIYLHGERDWTIRIEHDKRQTIGHDERLEVGNDRHKQVGSDERFEVGHDQRGEVGNDQCLRVGNDQSSTIAGNRSDSIGEHARESVGKSKTLAVGEDMQVRVDQELRADVRADARISVGKGYVLSVAEDASEAVSGDKQVESRNASTSTRADMSFASDKLFRVEAADDLSLASNAKVIVEAAEQMQFVCGDASITLQKDGTISLVGKDVSIKGSGKVVIKGQKLTGN